jgi:hypothetical protein
MTYDLSLEVETEKLLTTLKANRATHQERYQAALTVFKEKAATELRNRANDLENGRLDEAPEGTFHFQLPTPVSYISEYDGVIEMLEFSEQKFINITGQQYEAWVKDQWHWTHAFAMSTMDYVGN